MIENVFNVYINQSFSKNGYNYNRKKSKKVSVPNDEISYCISEFKYQREKNVKFHHVNFHCFLELYQQTKSVSESVTGVRNHTEPFFDKK